MGSIVARVTADPRPKYIKTQNYSCQLTQGHYLKVWLCSHKQLPDRRQVNRFWLWFEREFKIRQKLVTTITVLPQHLVSTNFSGIYFPNTGDILVKDFADRYMMLYVMAHEVLHAYWHQSEPNLPFGQHHNRIYCLDWMKPVEEYLQKASPRHRIYISPTIRLLMCAGQGADL